MSVVACVGRLERRLQEQRAERLRELRRLGVEPRRQDDDE
jgi:hypothetical protein